MAKTHRTSKTPIFDEFMDWCDQNHAHCRIKIDGASECMWSCEMSVTLVSTHGRPDRSHTVFVGGQSFPGDGLEPCAQDLAEWLNICMVTCC